MGRGTRGPVPEVKPAPSSDCWSQSGMPCGSEGLGSSRWASEAGKGRLLSGGKMFSRVLFCNPRLLSQHYFFKELVSPYYRPHYY